MNNNVLGFPLERRFAATLDDKIAQADKLHRLSRLRHYQRELSFYDTYDRHDTIEARLCSVRTPAASVGASVAPGACERVPAAAGVRFSSSSVGTCTPARNAFRGFALVLALVGVLFAGVAAAEPVAKTICWTPPTERVDGTPMAPSELTEYRMRAGLADQPDELVAIFTPLEQPTDCITLDLEPGDWKVRLRVIAVENQWSEWSETVFFTVTEAPPPGASVLPNPPTKLTVTDPV